MCSECFFSDGGEKAETFRKGWESGGFDDRRNGDRIVAENDVEWRSFGDGVSLEVVREFEVRDGVSPGVGSSTAINAQISLDFLVGSFGLSVCLRMIRR